MNAQQILEKSRKLFESHWIGGNFIQRQGGSVGFCSVGGLRVVAKGLEIDNASGDLHYQELRVAALDEEMEDRGYEHALRELCLIVDPEEYGDYLANNTTPSIEAMECMVIEWNDRQDSKRAILSAYDEAIAKMARA